MLTLEKYIASASRYTCPACGKAKTFVRYVDESGGYLADHVGRCDRESKCGYHFKPRDYFTESGEYKNLRKPEIGAFPYSGTSWQSPYMNRGLQSTYAQKIEARKPDHIDKRHLIETLDHYQQNTFVQFLLELFPFDPEDVMRAVGEYKIGTKCGYTIFPYIDQAGRVCKGQARTFDRNGHRQKESSFEHLLKAEGNLRPDFETDKRVLFGEHLLQKYPGLTIAIVEAPKTAVIASICKRVFPDLVWLAAGALSWLNADKLERIGRGRTIILFPDAKAFDRWQGIASEASKRGINVRISDLLETAATSEEYAEGSDLADYLIGEQRKRSAPAIRAAYAEMIEERIAIMMYAGGLSREEAQLQLAASGYLDWVERIVLGIRVEESKN